MKILRNILIVLAFISFVLVPTNGILMVKGIVPGNPYNLYFMILAIFFSMVSFVLSALKKNDHEMVDYPISPKKYYDRSAELNIVLKDFDLKDVEKYVRTKKIEKLNKK